MNYLKDLRTFKSGAMLGNSDLQKFIGVEKKSPQFFTKALGQIGMGASNIELHFQSLQKTML